jgi:hypothetical protein
MKRQQHLLILIFLMFTVIISWLLSADLSALVFRGIQIDTVGHFFGFFMLTFYSSDIKVIVAGISHGVKRLCSINRNSTVLFSF